MLNLKFTCNWAFFFSLAFLGAWIQQNTLWILSRLYRASSFSPLANLPQSEGTSKVSGVPLESLKQGHWLAAMRVADFRGGCGLGAQEGCHRTYRDGRRPHRSRGHRGGLGWTPVYGFSLPSVREGKSSGGDVFHHFSLVCFCFGKIFIKYQSQQIHSPWSGKLGASPKPGLGRN